MEQGDYEAALAQAQTLEGYGDAGQEELAQLIRAFQTATEGLTSGESINDIDLHRW